MITIVLTAAVIVCAVVDARTGRIPNAITGPAIIIVAAVSAVHPATALAAAVCAGPYLIAFTRGLCGGGDVKLAAVCGGLLADPGLAAATVVGAAFITGIVLAARRARAVAHGPALVAVTLAWLVTGLVGPSGTIDMCCVG
ncbi:MAG: A24 family peptidase [Gordonia sp. (in: high G+C Gram-positive bacteria)]|nr:A24 family peptidase [Gordonia sp. (in: high G+C Gram-positive bacteria)]